MSEVNYRRNGMNPPSRLRRLRRAGYSTTGKCWGMAPTLLRHGYGGQEAGVVASDSDAAGTPRPQPKSSRECRAAKKR